MTGTQPHLHSRKVRCEVGDTGERRTPERRWDLLDLLIRSNTENAPAPLPSSQHWCRRLQQPGSTSALGAGTLPEGLHSSLTSGCTLSSPSKRRVLGPGAFLKGGYPLTLHCCRSPNPGRVLTTRPHRWCTALSCGVSALGIQLGPAESLRQDD